jgi:hypothetical protein
LSYYMLVDKQLPCIPLKKEQLRRPLAAS